MSADAGISFAMIVEEVIAHMDLVKIQGEEGELKYCQEEDDDLNLFKIIYLTLKN